MCVLAVSTITSREKTESRGKKRKPRVGLLAVGKTKLHEDYLLHDPNHPLIPGTDVPRLSLVYLGPKTPVTTDDEVNRVIAGLQRWAAERARRACQCIERATAAEARS